MSEMIDRLVDVMQSRGLMADDGDAVAILKALWDPTEAMCREFSADDRAVYQAMIDAALQEPTP